MGAGDLLEEDQRGVHLVALGSSLHQPVKPDQHHSTHLGMPGVLVPGREQVVRALSQAERRAEGDRLEILVVVRRSDERHQMVGDEGRVDGDRVDCALPGARRDEAEQVLRVLARVDELQRVGQHPQEPRAPAASHGPDPHQPRLELLVVEVQARGWRVSLSSRTLSPMPHLRSDDHRVPARALAGDGFALTDRIAELAKLGAHDALEHRRLLGGHVLSPSPRRRRAEELSSTPFVSGCDGFECIGLDRFREPLLGSRAGRATRSAERGSTRGRRAGPRSEPSSAGWAGGHRTPA